MPNQSVYEIKLVTTDGYAVHRVVAPSAGHVIAMLAEEDKDDLAADNVTQVSVTRVQL